MRFLRIVALTGWAGTSALAGELFVAAAASLTDVMKAVEPRYAAVRPGVTLTFVYGSTGALRAQVLRGAPCDVFLGADRCFGGCATNVADVVTPDSVRTVAVNALVVVAGKGAEPRGDTLGAWLERARKIGIGHPEAVPAGRYAKALLQGEKLWPVASRKAVMATNVREVLMWLRQGAVDVGFVYCSDLAAANDPALTVLARYERPGGVPIEFAGGVARASRQAVEARAFLDFLKTDEAAGVWSRLGFCAP